MLKDGDSLKSTTFTNISARDKASWNINKHNFLKGEDKTRRHLDFVLHAVGFLEKEISDIIRNTCILRGKALKIDERQ